MPHTIHPAQKPSDDESIWQRCVESIANGVAERNALAVAQCEIQLQNYRAAKTMCAR